MWYAVLSRRPSTPKEIEWRLLWSYRELLAGDPNGKKDVLQNLNNILFFIPFGVLFPYPASIEKKQLFQVICSAAVLSIAVEASQYIFSLGLCELDDVICNTLGAVVGYGLICLVRREP